MARVAIVIRERAVTGAERGELGMAEAGRGALIVPAAGNGGLMSADITSAASVEAERPYGSVPGERGTLGTLSWPRAVKVASLAAAVGALAAASIAAGHMIPAAGAPAQAHPTSVIVSPQRAPAP